MLQRLTLIIRQHFISLFLLSGLLINGTHTHTNKNLSTLKYFLTRTVIAGFAHPVHLQSSVHCFASCYHHHYCKEGRHIYSEHNMWLNSGSKGNRNRCVHLSQHLLRSHKSSVVHLWWCNFSLILTAVFNKNSGHKNSISAADEITHQRAVNKDFPPPSPPYKCTLCQILNLNLSTR